MDHTRYQQWKHSWLTCGRVLLTLAALTIVTLVLYLASQNGHLLQSDDHEKTHVVRYRRDKNNDNNHNNNNNIATTNIHYASIQQSQPSDGNKRSHHKNELNKTLDTSITSVTNDNKTLLSDKSVHFDAITYHSDDTRQTVEEGGNKQQQRIKYAAHDKYKMKRKRKKIMSNVNRSSSSSSSSDIKLPKNSIRAYRNVTDVNGLENFSPDMVMDENKIAATNNVRQKKDQLIIREDQGVVIVRKYTCIPCQRVPGQRTSIKTRPRYRGMFFMFLRHACC